MGICVDLFQRSEDCWVAAGDARQWSKTHDRLGQLACDLREAMIRVNEWNWPLGLHDDIRCAERLTKEAYEAIYKADDYGRMSRELFPAEAAIIQRAIA